jgi:hypothetical protein
MSFKDLAAKELAAAHASSIKGSPEVKTHDAPPKGQPSAKAVGGMIEATPEAKP